MIQPRYTSAVRCARLESHRASLGVTLDAHSYLPALRSLHPSHPNPHPLPLSPSHSPMGQTAPGRLTATCSRRLSPLRFARLLLQVAISPPFALIGGGPLFSRPPLRSPEFIGYRTEIMMILPPSGAACPRRTPGAAHRVFRFGQAARPRRYRLRNVAA